MTIAVRIWRYMVQLNVEAKLDRLRRKSEAPKEEERKSSPRPSHKYPTGFQPNPQIKYWPPRQPKHRATHGAHAA